MLQGNITNLYTYTIHTPAAMFRGFTVTQFHTPEMAQAARFGHKKRQSNKISY